MIATRLGQAIELSDLGRAESRLEIGPQSGKEFLPLVVSLGHEVEVLALRPTVPGKVGTMFEELWNEDDLEMTENVMRVKILSLKKVGDPYPLMRLYGPLALVLARRSKFLDAQDALNDAEFLLVEHGWRGTEKEAWMLLDQAKVMLAFGQEGYAKRCVEQIEPLLREDSEPELLAEHVRLSALVH